LTRPAEEPVKVAESKKEVDPKTEFMQKIHEKNSGQGLNEDQILSFKRVKTASYENEASNM